MIGEALGPEVGGLIALFHEGLPVGCYAVAVGVVMVGGLEVEQSVSGVVLEGGDAFWGCFFGEAAIGVVGEAGGLAAFVGMGGELTGDVEGLAQF